MELKSMEQGVHARWEVLSELGRGGEHATESPSPEQRVSGPRRFQYGANARDNARQKSECPPAILLWQSAMTAQNPGAQEERCNTCCNSGDDFWPFLAQGEYAENHQREVFKGCRDAET